MGKLANQKLRIENNELWIRWIRSRFLGREYMEIMACVSN